MIGYCGFLRKKQCPVDSQPCCILDQVIAHPEPDILECEVKWTLGGISMNKAGGGDGIPVELLQILKDDAVKVLHSICQQIWKTQQWPQVRKRSISFQSQSKAMPKNVQTTTQLHSPHTLANTQNSPSQASTVRELRTFT